MRRHIGVTKARPHGAASRHGGNDPGTWANVRMGQTLAASGSGSACAPIRRSPPSWFGRPQPGDSPTTSVDNVLSCSTRLSIGSCRVPVFADVLDDEADVRARNSALFSGRHHHRLRFPLRLRALRRRRRGLVWPPRCQIKGRREAANGAAAQRCSFGARRCQHHAQQLASQICSSERVINWRTASMLGAGEQLLATAQWLRDWGRSRLAWDCGRGVRNCLSNRFRRSIQTANLSVSLESYR